MVPSLLHKTSAKPSHWQISRMVGTSLCGSMCFCSSCKWSRVFWQNFFWALLQKNGWHFVRETGGAKGNVAFIILQSWWEGIALFFSAVSPFDQFFFCSAGLIWSWVRVLVHHSDLQLLVPLHQQLTHRHSPLVTEPRTALTAPSQSHWCRCAGTGHSDSCRNKKQMRSRAHIYTPPSNELWRPDASIWTSWFWVPQVLDFGRSWGFFGGNLKFHFSPSKFFGFWFFLTILKYLPFLCYFQPFLILFQLISATNCEKKFWHNMTTILAISRHNFFELLFQPITNDMSVWAVTQAGHIPLPPP